MSDEKKPLPERTMRFSESTWAAIEETMTHVGCKTPQEAVRRAISDELFITRERSRGGEFLIEEPTKQGSQKRYKKPVWNDAITPKLGDSPEPT